MIPSRNRKPKLRFLRRFAAIAYILEGAAAIFHFFRRHWQWLFRARKFGRGEARELRQLFGGQEGWRQYAHDSLALLRDFLIPHHGNDHRPHALRPPSLLIYTVVAIGLKVLTSGALFLYYPSPAQLARVVAQEIVGLANHARLTAGVPPLQVDATLQSSALAKGEDMMTRDYFAHDSPDGRKPWSWINREQYDYIYAGENLAVDFLSAEAIHEAFMKSPSHRQNIMNGKYQDIGVAVVHGQLAGRETELLVQFFGTRRPATSAVAMAPRVVPRASPPPAPSPKASLVPSRAPTPPTTPAVATPLPAVQPEPSPSPSDIAVLAVTPTPKERPELAPVVSAVVEEPPPEAPFQSNEPILVLGAENDSSRVVGILLTFSNFFFVALAVFLAIALLLNIFIRFRIQHPGLILQSIAVVSLLVAMLLTKFHFLERIGNHLRIL